MFGHDPTGAIYGLPSYPWRLAPEGLATRRQLRARGLRPGGQEAVAQVMRGRRRREAGPAHDTCPHCGAGQGDARAAYLPAVPHGRGLLHPHFARNLCLLRLSGRGLARRLNPHLLLLPPGAAVIPPSDRPSPRVPSLPALLTEAGAPAYDRHRHGALRRSAGPTRTAPHDHEAVRQDGQVERDATGRQAERTAADAGTDGDAGRGPGARRHPHRCDRAVLAHPSVRPLRRRSRTDHLRCRGRRHGDGSVPTPYAAPRPTRLLPRPGAFSRHRIGPERGRLAREPCGITHRLPQWDVLAAFFGCQARSTDDRRRYGRTRRLSEALGAERSEEQARRCRSAQRRTSAARRTGTVRRSGPQRRSHRRHWPPLAPQHEARSGGSQDGLGAVAPPR